MTNERDLRHDLKKFFSPRSVRRHWGSFFFLLAVPIIIFVVGIHVPAQAEYKDYNRPSPIMDYVPQEMGTKDTVYDNLTEANCRKCHGNDTHNRHHLTDSVQVYGLCSPCHVTIAEFPFILVNGDCLTSGCHSTDDLETNGWHHNSDYSDSGNCVACHNSNIIDELSPLIDPDIYPPNILTPAVFNCENCHWEQAWIPGEDKNNPGHPSTYDHTNFGYDIGYFEYATPLLSISDTHHMGFRGNVGTNCSRCHTQNPNNPSWDPYDPNLIRQCQCCHSMDTLHDIHVKDVNGWKAIGFHVPLDNTRTRDKTPKIYTTFTASESCSSCHDIDMQGLPDSDVCTGKAPIIDIENNGILPGHGSCGAIIGLSGENFGDTYLDCRLVKIRKRVDGEWDGPWIEMPVIDWLDTYITFEIPCEMDLSSGNYIVRVITECGKSNQATFSLENRATVDSITTDTVVRCGEWIVLEGKGLGDDQSEIYPDGYHGVHRIVDFQTLARRTFTATEYVNWSDMGLEVKFDRFFRDTAAWGDGNRNYVQDNGTGQCTVEPDILSCQDMPTGNWSVVFRTIYFGDDDGSGDLNCSDTIFQVTTSNPVFFCYDPLPTIDFLSLDEIETGTVLTIHGDNFGKDFSAYDVRIGSKKQARDPTLNLGKHQKNIISWADNKIQILYNLPSKWEGKTKYVWLENSKDKSEFEPWDIPVTSS